MTLNGFGRASACWARLLVVLAMAVGCGSASDLPAQRAGADLKEEAADNPFVFNFDPVDRSVGCPYPWTAATTPAGIFFLASDFNVYLVSKFGGPARVGVARFADIDHAGRTAVIGRRDARRGR